MSTFNDLLKDIAYVLKKHNAQIELSESPSEIALVKGENELYIDCGSPISEVTLTALVEDNPPNEHQLSWEDNPVNEHQLSWIESDK